MHVPPWRKRDYMLAKWISPSAARSKQVSDAAAVETVSSVVDNESGELELIFGEIGEKESPEEVVTAETAMASPAWQLPAVKPKSGERGMKVVTGLASLLKEKP
nr:unknown [Medicago truncatula]